MDVLIEEIVRFLHGTPEVQRVESYSLLFEKIVKKSSQMMKLAILNYKVEELSSAIASATVPVAAAAKAKNVKAEGRHTCVFGWQKRKM